MSRILFVSRVIPMHGIGGMQQIAWDLACQMGRMGHEVRFLTTPVPGRGEQFVLDGLPVVTMPGNRPGRLDSAWWRMPGSVLADVGTVDGVVSVGLGGLPVFAAEAGARRLFQVHGTRLDDLESKHPSGGRWRRWTSIRPHDLRFMARERRILRLSDVVVPVGPRVLETLRGPPYRWWVPTEVSLIPNGVDAERFRPDARARVAWRERLGLEGPVVLTATRLVPDKGVARSLEVFARFVRRVPDAVHLVLGDGPERRSLEALAARLGITESVRFVGVVDRGEVPEVYAAADAFLFTPYRREGHPLNILEALASGLPGVVTSRLLDGTWPANALGSARYDDVAGLVDQLEVAMGQPRVPRLPDDLSLQTCAARYLKALS